jgi:glucosamine--fructose-6-phosphate aminotransferase (isomerizing)
MAGIGKQSIMYQTIHRQPADLQRVLDTGWEDAKQAGAKVAEAARTYIVGIGTSYHAALFGSWIMRSVGLDARAISSFDFARYPQTYPLTPDDAVIVLSHSGAKQFSLTALDVAVRAGAALMSVGGIEAKHPGSELILRTTERERSAAFTSSHLAAMTVLAQVAVEARTALGPEAAAGTDTADALRLAISDLPGQIESMLAREQDIDLLAESTVARHSYVVGGGPSEVAAIEAVIKGREAAYVRIDGMALEQFIHGPMICLQQDDTVVLVNVAGASSERNGDAARLLQTLGVQFWTVGTDLEGNAGSFAVPETVEVLSPILTTVPMQLWAWQMATLQQIDPDTFRRQDPRFAQAVGDITL